MLKDKYDVVIVGSGPAGASAARTINGKDLNTLIVEKAKLPRYKMCSGILFPAAYKFIIDYFGDIPEKVYCEPLEVRGARDESTLDSQFVELPFTVFDPNPSLPRYGKNISRPGLDYWLSTCNDAQLIDNCEFRNYKVHKDSNVLQVKLSGDVKEIEARYLIGADGCLSRVRRTTEPEFDKTLRLIPQYEEWYIGQIDLEPGPLYTFRDRRITGFFAGVFQKDGKIIVGTGTKQGEPLKELFGHFVAHLRKKYGLQIRQTVAKHGCVLHDMSATDNFYLGKGNVLLAGEAGGFNRCAEGITSALLTGRSAGEAVLRSIESRTPAIEHYAEAVVGEKKQCMQVNKIMKEASGCNPFTRD